ncbi:uncharacterized protein [Paralichthys olivaceus]|uniref:uncharacterized protein n=1 Tax=Paralichthys olivaceus TaxID=8255 RepID=UPI00375285FC
MFSFMKLLCVLALTLLPVSEASWGEGDATSHSYDLSGSALTRVYNSPVYLAERMKRPLAGSSIRLGPISHSGVRVTLQDGAQWLIHKGDGYGISSDTVVTDAGHMSSSWEVVARKNFEGSKTVSDFVRTGGSDYSLLFDNCHLSSRRMMNQRRRRSGQRLFNVMK